MSETISISTDTDAAISQRIAAYLSTLQVPALRRLRIVVQRQVVTVMGEVNTFYERQLALHFIRRVPGVLSAVDHIAVAASRSNPDSSRGNGTAKGGSKAVSRKAGR